MKAFVLIASVLMAGIAAMAQVPADTTAYPLPDSVKAAALIATVYISGDGINNKEMAGIKANGVSVALRAGKTKHEVRFAFPNEMGITAKGLDVGSNRRSLNWTFKAEGMADYKLLLASAGDSSENFMLYSGYIYFPKLQKWKLIGTCRVPNQWTTLKKPVSFATTGPPRQALISVGNIWCQHSNGSWKPLTLTDAPPPVLPPFSNMDSARQFVLDSIRLQSDIVAGKTDLQYLKEGVFYAMMQEGTGKQVSVSDTVSVFYKGYLYADGKVFDQTKEKPARFPLARLIKGWQIGLPLCKVGGKIKLVILSGQAYSIRTRAAKIPPNSILVFEIEVVKSE